MCSQPNYALNCVSIDKEGQFSCNQIPEYQNAPNYQIIACYCVWGILETPPPRRQKFVEKGVKLVHLCLGT